MTSLDRALVGVTSVGIDTAPFIYFIERHPIHAPVMRAFAERVDEGRVTGFNSVITLTEVLTKPIQTGNVRLEQEYRNLLLHSRNLWLTPIDRDTAQQAASLRVRYQLRTPDALQVASAVQHGCQAFLTNDVALQRVNELRVLLVSDLTV